MKIFLTVVTVALLTTVVLMSSAGAAPHLALFPSTFEFSAVDTTDYFRVWNDGDAPLVWNLTSNQSWLSAVPSSGNFAPGEFVKAWISLDRTGLSDGTYSGQFAVTSNGGNTTVYVTMIVQNAPKLSGGDGLASLSAGRTYYDISIRNLGISPLEWNAVSDAPWIDIVPPTSGSLSYMERRTVRINLDAGALPSQDEEQIGHVMFGSNGGSAVTTVRFLPVSQSPGMLGIYSDAMGTDCNIVATTPSLKPVYVVHTRTDGATACQFSAPKPACWTNAVYLSDTNAFAVNVGNSQTGAAVGYGTCRTNVTNVMTINYFIQTAPTQFCCPYPVLPDPNSPSGRIDIVDCGSNLVYSWGATAIVNPNATCMCSLPSVAAEETTWGRVKALYAPK